jgi:hypothetical protein
MTRPTSSWRVDAGRPELPDLLDSTTLATKRVRASRDVVGLDG